MLLSTRPSTSGGRRMPVSKETSSLASLTKPALVDRRMSRDDFFLTAQPRRRAATFDNKRMSRDDMSLGNHHVAARKAAFHIPLRSQTIGEGVGMRDTPPPSFARHVYKSESLASGEIQIGMTIGMALGSPVHPPTPEQFQAYPQEQPYLQVQSAAHTQAPRQQPLAQENYSASAFTSGNSSQPDAPAQYQTSVPASVPASAPAPAPISTSASKPASPPTASMQRSKSTRRKIFGFFGSKKADVKPAMPELVSRAPAESGEHSSAAMTSAASQSSQTQISTPILERSTTKGGNRKYQPIIIAGEPEPSSAGNTNTTVLEAPAPPSTGLKSSPSFRGKRPFLRSKASEPAIRKRPDIPNPVSGAVADSSAKGVSTNPTIVHPSAATGATSHHHIASPYLNIDIPEASMERYSIMFGGLLQTGPSASSLLARRQATLDKLKTINDKMHHDDLGRSHANAIASDAYLQVGGLQRRATSPHARSPSFSLFPSKSPGSTHHHNLLTVNAGARSPLQRSNTSPAATHSPMRAEFDFSKPYSQRNALRENPTGLARKVPVVSHMGLAVSTMPSPAAAVAAHSVIYFDPAQASPLLGSPAEMTPPMDDHKTWKETTQELPAFKPVIQEPQWQMVQSSNISHNSNNSNNSNGSNGSASSKPTRSKASSSTANTSHTSSPATDMSAELQVDEPNSALKSAVESSIARQISVSRQQREMLRPLKTGTLYVPPPSGSPALSRSATLKLGRNEWLHETKASTPTLVVAPELDSNYGYSSNSGERSRSNTVPQQPARDLDDPSSAHYLSPRHNTPAYQLAQNRKSERVILEAA